MSTHRSFSHSPAAYVGTTVVIPTRNRSDLAQKAILSVTCGRRDDVDIFVADNSTSDEHLQELEAFCSKLGHTRVRYGRPPTPLPMAENWEWALQQARRTSPLHHIVVLTDRMFFKSGGLDRLLHLVQRRPDVVISYSSDTVNDTESSIILEQAAWSGSVFELHSRDVLSACAELGWRFYDCLPRMLNSIVPPHVFDRITERYGDVFRSIAPDLCFAFRFMERFESYLYYDRALIAQGALSRSHGYSQASGRITSEYADFVKTLGGTTINFASPIPGLNTNMNTVIHEYCLVRQASASEKLPPLNIANYLAYVSSEVSRFEDAALKERMESLIRAHESYDPVAASVRRRAWFGMESARTRFTTVDEASRHAVEQPRRRNWGPGNEEAHVEVKLAFGAQESAVAYLRAFVVLTRRWTERGRDAFSRHIGWRLQRLRDKSVLSRMSGR